MFDKATPTCPYCGTYMVLGGVGFDLNRSWFACVHCAATSAVAPTAEEARAAALHRAPQWHSVKDSLPDEKERVLFYTQQGAERIGHYSYTGKQGTVWFASGRGKAYTCCSATHWTELPEKPPVMLEEKHEQSD